MGPLEALLMTDRNRDITATVLRERAKLASFIRRRVADPGDAEDIMQDVFHDLVRAYRLPEPIEQVGAWLYRVARNRIIDRFRKRKGSPLSETWVEAGEPDGEYLLDLSLPTLDSTAEAVYARNLVLTALQQALDELPTEQREVFIAHELEGSSFKEIAIRTGVALNTLLARKRYAVLHLRSRLQAVYDEFDI
jgi:RNA polymerase sigma factor (sigma-70 family)